MTPLYVSFELRYGTGLNDDQINIGNDQMSVNTDQFYGAYFRLGHPVSSSIYPYFLVGYTSAKFEIGNDLEWVRETKSDTSFGIGADWFINNKFGLNFEFAKYISKNMMDLNVSSVGITISF